MKNSRRETVPPIPTIRSYNSILKKYLLHQIGTRKAQEDLSELGPKGLLWAGEIALEQARITLDQSEFKAQQNITKAGEMMKGVIDDPSNPDFDYVSTLARVHLAYRLKIFSIYFG